MRYFDVLASQLSTSGRRRVLQVARHVQDRVLHAGCHSRMFSFSTSAATAILHLGGFESGPTDALGRRLTVGRRALGGVLCGAARMVTTPFLATRRRCVCPMRTFFRSRREAPIAQ